MILTLARSLDFLTVGVLVVVINIAQWLLAPYLIGWMYKVREIKQDEKPELHQMVADLLSRKSGISTPKLMLAQIPLPRRIRQRFPTQATESP